MRRHFTLLYAAYISRPMSEAQQATARLKPNSITLAGSKLVADLQRAEIWPII